MVESKTASSACIFKNLQNYWCIYVMVRVWGHIIWTIDSQAKLFQSFEKFSVLTETCFLPSFLGSLLTDQPFPQQLLFVDKTKLNQQPRNNVIINILKSTGARPCIGLSLAKHGLSNFQLYSSSYQYWYLQCMSYLVHHN